MHGGAKSPRTLVAISLKDINEKPSAAQQPETSHAMITSDLHKCQKSR